MIQTDAVVIGAGPVGLFQVFQLGLLGLQAHLVDALSEPGGQCVALYPDKPIYDVPGVPVCTGRELAAQLWAQAQPFIQPGAANVHLSQLVSRLEVDTSAEAGQHRFHVHTSTGVHLLARGVVVAAGAGAFVPKALPIPGLDMAALPNNIHHHLPGSDAGTAWAGRHLVVAGGGDEALQSIIDIANAPSSQKPSRLSLLHRRDQFQADASLEAQVRALIAAGQVHLVLGVPQGGGLAPREPGVEPRLTALTLATAQGQESLPLDHLLVRQGMSPKLGPLLDWGLALERKQLSVHPATFETSVPGIHAVGDINTYPGKLRLLLCGFHEATLAAHAMAAALNPQAPQHLLYTTTSPLLRQRLGVT